MTIRNTHAHMHVRQYAHIHMAHYARLHVHPLLTQIQHKIENACDILYIIIGIAGPSERLYCMIRITDWLYWLMTSQRLIRAGKST